jgi:hypothetical protein
VLHLPDNGALYHPELAFLTIGDLYTMSPGEAAVACRC